MGLSIIECSKQFISEKELYFDSDIITTSFCDAKIDCIIRRAFYKTARDSGEHKRAFEVSTSVIQNTMNGQYWPEGDTEYHHGISCPTLLIHGSEDQLISVEEELEMKEVGKIYK